MNQRICSIALMGGLTLLFCIPLSAKTLYVADNGDNTTGLSWETAHTTIQAAVIAAAAGSATDPNAVTIIVGSAGTGHGSGQYIENIDISLAQLTLESESGYEQTFLQAAAGNDHAIAVTGDSVTIRGFSVSGTTTTGTAGIALSGADYCTIENNRCGWQAAFKNHRGITLISSNHNTIRNNLCARNSHAGIYLSGSSNNLITGNTCSYSGNAGIALQNNSHQNRVIGNTCSYNSLNGLDLDNANLNTLAENRCTNNTNHPGISVSSAQNNVVAQNLCSGNSYGIEITYSGRYNSITLNLTENNTYDGIQLMGYYNQIVANTCRSNYRHGLDCYESKDNTLYWNDYRGNTNKPVNAYYRSSTGDTWSSAGPFCYAYYNGMIHSGRMGNFYDNYSGSDTNGDGIGETPYILYTPVQDEYPLTDPNMTYAIQAWFLGGQETMTMEPNQAGMWQTLEAGSSAVWLSETAALEEIRYYAMDSSDGWNGRIRFSTAVAGSSFEIAVGSADPNDGIFVPGGAQTTLIGTSEVFAFETIGETFFVQPGKALAVQITNNSGTAREIYVGGAWSYISAPSGTDTAWPGVPEPVPPANPGDLDGDGWVNMRDAGYLSARWGLTGCAELNEYCQFADIDKSGDVGLGDLEIVAIFWTMGPDDLLTGDWNEDFKVNMDDVALLSSFWTGDLNDLVDLCENWLLGVF